MRHRLFHGGIRNWPQAVPRVGQGPAPYPHPRHPRPRCTCSWARDSEDRPGSIRPSRPCSADTLRPRSARCCSSEDRIAPSGVSPEWAMSLVSERARSLFRCYSSSNREAAGASSYQGMPRPRLGWSEARAGMDRTWSRRPVQSGLPAGEPPHRLRSSIRGDLANGGACIAW